MLGPPLGKDRDLPVAKGHPRPSVHLSGEGALRVLLIPNCTEEARRGSRLCSSWVEGSFHFLLLLSQLLSPRRDWG